MQRGVVTLGSEEGDGGIRPWKCVHLACGKDVHESRQKAPECGDVSISEELGVTGRPSKHAELSSRITIVEYKRTCQLLPI